MGPTAPLVAQHGARSIGRPSIRPIGSWPRPGVGCARTGPPTVCGRKRGLLVWHLRWGYPTELRRCIRRSATALIGHEQLQLIDFVVQLRDSGFLSGPVSY